MNFNAAGITETSSRGTSRAKHPKNLLAQLISELKTIFQCVFHLFITHLNPPSLRLFPIKISKSTDGFRLVPSRTSRTSRHETYTGSFGVNRRSQVFIKHKYITHTIEHLHTKWLPSWLSALSNIDSVIAAVEMSVKTDRIHRLTSVVGRIEALDNPAVEI